MQQSVVVYSLPISRVVGKEQCDKENLKDEDHTAYFSKDR